MMNRKKFPEFLFLWLLALWFTSGCKSAKPAEIKKGPEIETKALSKSEDGIYPPSQAELVAIQKRNPNVTLEHLQEGYILYTKGACINCHQPFNIYQFSESKWNNILEEMAVKAQISNQQKAAIFAFVLSIKDTKSNH